MFHLQDYNNSVVVNNDQNLYLNTEEMESPQEFEQINQFIKDR